MEVDEAIASRASVKKFADRDVPKELIEKCLELAVWAPNHRLTEPWRFRVVTDRGRDALADAIREQLASDSSRVDQTAGTDNAETKGLFSEPLQFAATVRSSVAAEQVRRKIMSAPVLIVVYSLRAVDETITRENFAATAAAVQNLLLGAHHLGLAAIWRTADYFAGDKTRAFLQIPAEADFVAAVYLGFPDQRDTTRKRTPAQQWTVWFQN
ncbi:MAG: nitroreductase family protein [Bacilli bacterium]